MARSTMTAVIARTRLLIGDPAGSAQTFSDDEIQATLDEHRFLASLELLAAQPIYSGGTLTYRQFVSLESGWEADVRIQDASYLTLTPEDADPGSGRWSFTTGRTQPYLWISGTRFDLFGAAADLLEAWAAKLTREFDFDSDGQRFLRSQQATALNALAERYRRKRRVTSGILVRTDGG